MRAVLLAFAALMLAPGSTVQAQQPAPGQVSIVARDQPIAAFLQELFGQLGRPVVIEPGLTGTVNGAFRGGGEQVFRDIAKAFSLVGYDDGAAMHVYPATAIGSRVLAVGGDDARRIIRSAAELGLPDPSNTLRLTSDGVLAVRGAPRFLDQIDAMARMPVRRTATRGAAPKADDPLDPLEFRVFYLRYARAEDVTVNAGGREVTVPGLATILKSLVLDQTVVPSGVTYSSRPVRPTQPSLRGRGLAGIAPEAEATPILGYPSDLATGDYTTPAVVNSDPVRIEANPALNAIIVRDARARMPSYESLIRALDVEPQLVEIEATIIDINTRKLRELGINWRFSSDGFSSLFGNGTDSDLRLLPNGQRLRDNTLNVTPQSRGLSISTIIGSDREFIARINALEAKGAARVVSRPQVMTLSNVEAVFDRTRTFYVRVAGRAEVDLFNVTAGTVLRVNPHVFRDKDSNRIRVLIGIEDGAVTRDEVDNIPVVERSSVTTQAMVVEGQSLLLGGLTVDAEMEDEDKVPLLGDLPVVGELFKSRSRSRDKTERLFLITPRIVDMNVPQALPASAQMESSQ